MSVSDELPTEREVFRTMHDLLEGIAQIAENHGFERGDDLQVWLANNLPHPPAGNANCSKEAELSDAFEMAASESGEVIIAMEGRIKTLEAALTGIMDAVSDIRGIDVEGYKPDAFAQARAALNP
jgi:hypothetical protein